MHNIEHPDLYPYITRLIKWAVKLFKSYSATQEDTNYVRLSIDGSHHIGLTFSPQILYYYEDNRLVAKIWVRAKVEEHKDKIKSTARLLKSFLKKHGINPFYDQDAFYKIFSRPKPVYNWDDFYEFSFFIHPAYPKGYWDNHTIEDL